MIDLVALQDAFMVGFKLVGLSAASGLGLYYIMRFMDSLI